MMTIETIGPGILSIDVTGKIEKEHIEQAIVSIDEALQSNDKISLLVDMSAYASITPEAVMTDLRYGIKQLSELSHYERIAIISATGWMAALIRIEDAIFRSIDIRHFTIEERDTAHKFATGQLVDTTPEPHAVKHIPTDRNDVVAITIAGHLNENDAKAMTAILADKFERYEKIDLLVTVDSYEGFDISMLLSGDLWSVKWDAISKIRRYALVGAPAYIQSMAMVSSGVLPYEFRAFQTDQEDDAWAWINAAPLEA